MLATPIRRVLKDNADIALQLIIGREMKAASDDANVPEEHGKCRKSMEYTRGCKRKRTPIII